MDALAFPFRLNSTGQVALVLQGSEAHLAQQAYAFVNTRPLELLLAPTYGLQDPAFRVVDEGEIIVGLSRFHPDLSVERVFIDSSRAEGTTDISIEFSTATATTVPVEAEVIFGA